MYLTHKLCASVQLLALFDSFAALYNFVTNCNRSTTILQFRRTCLNRIKIHEILTYLLHLNIHIPM